MSRYGKGYLETLDKLLVVRGGLGYAKFAIFLLVPVNGMETVLLTPLPLREIYFSM